MRRGRAALPVLLALLGTVACATRAPAGADQQVQSAFGRYCALVLAMDHAGIAAMFSSDGEIVNAGQAPIRGPAAINAFLAGFADYRVLAYSADAPQTHVTGDYASLQSIYHEQVRLPDGNVVAVSGHLEALWRRSPRGRWYVTRMATRPL